MAYVALHLVVWSVLLHKHPPCRKAMTLPAISMVKFWTGIQIGGIWIALTLFLWLFGYAQNQFVLKRLDHDFWCFKSAIRLKSFLLFSLHQVDFIAYTLLKFEPARHFGAICWCLSLFYWKYSSPHKNFKFLEIVTVCSTSFYIIIPFVAEMTSVLVQIADEIWFWITVIEVSCTKTRWKEVHFLHKKPQNWTLFAIVPDFYCKIRDIPYSMMQIENILGDRSKAL